MTSVHRPESVDEALALLAEHGDEAKVFAGGTALMILFRNRLLSVPHLVSLERVSELRSIVAGDDGVRIGAMTTLAEVADSADVRSRAPLLAQAVGLVANHRVRAVATVGGNLAEADYASDPPPVLIGYGASAHLASARGERTVPVDELLTSYYETCIAPDELLVAVEVPAAPARTNAVYLKFTTRSVEDRPCVGVAAFTGPGVARVVIGAVGATPLAIDAGGLDPETAGEQAAAAVEPLSDLRGSAGYRRRAVRALTARALRRAAAGETAAVRV
jgi:carbon-monoxide dehydrogenase medium subunit